MLDIESQIRQVFIDWGFTRSPSEEHDFGIVYRGAFARLCLTNYPADQEPFLQIDHDPSGVGMSFSVSRVVVNQRAVIKDPWWEVLTGCFIRLRPATHPDPRMALLQQVSRNVPDLPLLLSAQQPVDWPVILKDRYCRRRD